MVFGDADLNVSTVDVATTELATAQPTASRVLDVDGVAFDGQGGVWVVGTFTGNLYLGEGTDNAVTLTSAGDTDAFVARFLLQPP